MLIHNINLNLHAVIIAAITGAALVAFRTGAAHGPVTLRAAHDLVAAGAAGAGAAHRGAVGAGTAHRVVTALIVMTAGAAFQWPLRLILRGQKRIRGGDCHTRCNPCTHQIAQHVQHWAP